MEPPLITLTTDFGEGSPYVAAMKGVIASRAPTARILDLSHSIPPQDVRNVAYFLRTSLPYFPGGTVHTIVVDPGVGTKRAALLIEWQGQYLLAPDNGCWTWLPHLEEVSVRRLTERMYWRESISDTFHGRDIFAPVAAHLASGFSKEVLGASVGEWVKLGSLDVETTKQSIRGVVLYIDGFGNVITNVPAHWLQAGPMRCRLGDRLLDPVPLRVKTYGEAWPGDLVILSSSSDFIELAIVQGNAARALNASVGMSFTLELPVKEDER